MDLAVRRCYREIMSIPAEIPAPAKESLEEQEVGRQGRWLPFRHWNWRHFLFYLGVPAGIAAYAALNNWTILQLAGYETTLAFYASHAFVPWWTSAVATTLCMRLLRPWRPPQLVLLVLGSLLACILILPYSRWITEYFAVGWVNGDPDGRLSSEHIYREVGFWAFTARASVIWILVNVGFDRFLGLPRYRYDAVSAVPVTPTPGDAAVGIAAEPAATSSRSADEGLLRFLQRLPANVSADQVLALKAEQHYIKVYTADRSFMTLYRFSDAVAEMDPAVGQQVHRSYWIRNAAIRAIRRGSGKYSVELSNGLVVPISAGNRGLIREIARTRNFPVHSSH